VNLTCQDCGHVWPTEAKRGSNVQCPECKTRHYVSAADRPGLSQPAGAWDSGTPDDAEDDADDAEQGEADDWRCPVCQAPAGYTRSRGGIVCEQGHTSLSPLAVPRAVSYQETQTRKRERAASVALADNTPDMQADYYFRQAKLKSLADIKKTVTEYQGYREDDFAWSAVAEDSVLKLAAIYETVQAAKNANELAKAQTVISQDLTALENQLYTMRSHWASYGRNNDYRRVIQGEIMPDERKAIAAPAPAQKHYDDDDDDDYSGSDAIYKKPASLKTRLIRAGIFAGLSAIVIIGIASGKPITDAVPQSEASDLHKAVIDRASRRWGDAP